MHSTYKLVTIFKLTSLLLQISDNFLMLIYCLLPNSTIRSADLENPTLEANMKWIGWPIVENFPKCEVRRSLVLGPQYIRWCHVLLLATLGTYCTRSNNNKNQRTLDIAHRPRLVLPPGYKQQSTKNETYVLLHWHYSAAIWRIILLVNYCYTNENALHRWQTGVCRIRVGELDNHQN